MTVTEDNNWEKMPMRGIYCDLDSHQDLGLVHLTHDNYFVKPNSLRDSTRSLAYDTWIEAQSWMEKHVVFPSLRKLRLRPDSYVKRI